MADKHELTKIEDLAAASYNPRKISASAEDGLGKSIERFGDISGIVWNKRTGHIVSGHQRVKQLRRLGGQLLDGAIQINSGERFKIRVVDWKESDELAANVTANNQAISGEYDETIEEILNQVRGEIGDADFEGLKLDQVVFDPGEFPDIDLGDGEIEERESMKKFTVFVPDKNFRTIKKAIAEIVDNAGGAIVG